MRAITLTITVLAISIAPAHAQKAAAIDQMVDTSGEPITVPASGEISAERLATDVTLEPGPAESVFDEDESAFVIHSGADDYVTQPSDAAGDPIACGVIRR